jgi:hypothetical protein
LNIYTKEEKLKNREENYFEYRNHGGEVKKYGGDFFEYRYMWRIRRRF